MEPRTLYVRLWQELSADKPMILMAGPRQAGKTTLAKLLASGFANSAYCNWDISEDRVMLLRNPAFFAEMIRRDDSRPLVVLDEIHKHRHWKNLVKGLYDRFSDQYTFLVTGSGRLDLYQRAGDSLAGRYLLFHLWPFTVSELGDANRRLKDFLADPLRVAVDRIQEMRSVWEQLEAVGHFPEPYLRGSTTSWRRWSAAYSRQLIREDIRDLAAIRNVSDMENLYLLMPSRIGSPLSVSSFAGDLSVAYNTIQSWLDLFERFYLAFSVGTWKKRLARAIRKERKYYIFDVPRIQDQGARFENMVALELWRCVHAWNERGDGDFSLHFVKNKEGQEVDFLLANGRKPLLLVEAKLSDPVPGKSLLALQQQLSVPAVLLVRSLEGFRRIPNGADQILVATAYQWCACLPA
jgi:predicted AAA+ superfamily ATPase